MLCSTCLGANLQDQGEYYQCPRCNDIKPKCTHDRGVGKFMEVCLRKREPRFRDKVVQWVGVYHGFITASITLSTFIILMILFQTGGR